MKFECLPHPSYSPHITPSDYHISRKFKEALCGCQFANNEEVNDMVHTWLQTQEKTLFEDGIRKLMD
jgi:Holliday junction resolvasome RuvABC endonuclease subunit